MDNVCRLCCSTKFVNNYIFDDESALFLKMSLYMPIKIFKNDRLPKKICDKCSCKVNDFYQFCNETIEVEARLHRLLSEASDAVPSFLNKTESPYIQNSSKALIDQFTQTEQFEIKVKCEPLPSEPVSPIKQEEDVIPDLPETVTDNSDDELLIEVKKNKKSKKKSDKCEVKNSKARKRKVGFLDSVNADEVKNESDVNLSLVKEESEDDYVENKTKSDVFSCCICYVNCLTRSALLQHYKEHAIKLKTVESPPTPPFPDKTPARCSRCQKKISDEKAWESHWQGHWERDRRPYRCSLCERTFKDHQQILKHGIAHQRIETLSGSKAPVTLEKRFACDLCPEGFVYMRCLLAHRSAAHPAQAAGALALRCAACGRHFAHLNSLRRHMRSHSGERNYLCNVCGKALSSQEHLKFHIRIHTGYKPHVCKTCGKGFVKKCNLTLHERVHSGEKPYVCPHCGKAFSQRSTLVIHERYHSGARPYKCEVCGRGFVAKGLLSMHLKSSCVDVPLPFAARDAAFVKQSRVQRLADRP